MGSRMGPPPSRGGGQLSRSARRQRPRRRDAVARRRAGRERAIGRAEERRQHAERDEAEDRRDCRDTERRRRIVAERVAERRLDQVLQDGEGQHAPRGAKEQAEAVAVASLPGDLQHVAALVDGGSRQREGEPGEHRAAGDRRHALEQPAAHAAERARVEHGDQQGHRQEDEDDRAEQGGADDDEDEQRVADEAPLAPAHAQRRKPGDALAGEDRALPAEGEAEEPGERAERARQRQRGADQARARRQPLQQPRRHAGGAEPRPGRGVAPATRALVRGLDLGYLLAAIAVLVTGLLRVFFFAKGWPFYAANPVFWVKMALFLAVGLMSVPPTIHYIKTAKASRGGEIAIPDRTYRHIRFHLIGQLALFALIPLAATLMARGIGL